MKAERTSPAVVDRLTADEVAVLRGWVGWLGEQPAVHGDFGADRTDVYRKTSELNTCAR
jgi:hypothetical protein